MSLITSADSRTGHPNPLACRKYKLAGVHHSQFYEHGRDCMPVESCVAGVALLPFVGTCEIIARFYFEFGITCCFLTYNPQSWLSAKIVRAVDLLINDARKNI